MASTTYAIALGSNRRHGTHGAPAEILRAAIAAMGDAGLILESVSTVRATPALGPAGRSFANAVAIVSTDADPPELLDRLKAIEAAFGRRSGKRWGARVLDLDLLLWSEGCWEGPGLLIPHPEMRTRAFVLEPLAEIVPEWRDPVSGATMRQLLFRLNARSPVDRERART